MTKPEKMRVKFYNTSTSWIDFQITIGNKTFKSNFSLVFDPIEDCKNWF